MTCKNNSEKSSITKVGEHILCGYAVKIVNFENNKIIPLTNKERRSYASHEICHICKKKIEDKCSDD